MNTALHLVDRGLVPAPLLRFGIRGLLRDRLAEQRAIYGADRDAALDRWVEELRGAPIAPVPEKANEQHYELPPEFFEICLGARRKYSSAFYERADATLDEAEEAMLALTCERAALEDGQDVLELGCGWGSLTLWMAEQYPNSRILAVSNSAPQREHVLGEAKRRGLSNLRVLTRDMNELELEDTFDRVVSVEMFEHMRNWERLLGKVAGWLRPEGRLFLHVFAHERYAYPFEVRDESDWMSRFFFTGGMMPCPDLVARLDMPLEVEERWVVPGTHYARTSEHWLKNLERRREDALRVLAGTYGTGEARRWYQRWRVFFLACAELFAYEGGTEWIVSHQRLRLGGVGESR